MGNFFPMKDEKKFHLQRLYIAAGARRGIALEVGGALRFRLEAKNDYMNESFPARVPLGLPR